MKAAFEALVIPNPTVCVANPTNASSPSHSAGMTARRSMPVQESARAARVNRTASSSEAGIVSSASLTITKVDPQTTVIATRTPSPRAGDIRAILTRAAAAARGVPAPRRTLRRRPRSTAPRQTLRRRPRRTEPGRRRARRTAPPRAQPRQASRSAPGPATMA